MRQALGLEVAACVSLGLASASSLAQSCESGWNAVGTSGPTSVGPLLSYDIGNGPALYAISPAGLHQWSGHAWSVLSSMTGLKSIAGTDDGSGRAVYVSAAQVFRYREGAVEQVGDVYPTTYPGATLVGLAGRPGAIPSPLIALMSYGSNGLWAQIVSWTGQQWVNYRYYSYYKNIPLALGIVSMPQGYYMLAHDINAGYFAGVSQTAPLLPVITGCAGGCGTWATPRALISADLGTGPAAYAAGCFSYYGSCVTGQPAANVIKLSQPSQALGVGINQSVQCLAAFDDGSGMALFAGGFNFLSRWNGTIWTPILPSPSGMISSLTVHDDGYGSGLYSSGTFTVPGIPGIRDVARWGPARCYANCDNSRPPNGCAGLSAGDFQCFLNRFAAGDLRANCDASTAPPLLNANDFQCFLNRFAAGCS